MEKPTEQLILERTHSTKNALQTLANKYSMTGEKKPYLVLGSTVGGEAALVEPISGTDTPKRIDKKQRVAKYTSKFKLAKPRTALRQYISNVRRGKEQMEYAQVEALNRLWRLYMDELLFEHPNTKTEANHANMSANDLTQKLASADFQGAELLVSRARNPSLVGLKGIVVWDCKSCFVLALQACNPAQNDNKNSCATKSRCTLLKLVHKAGANFEFTLPHPASKLAYTFEIVGSRFCYRTADRAARKFKGRNVDDLV